MLSKIHTAGLFGIEGFDVCVETDIVNGMVAFELVGLPDAAVKEAKERVKSAIRNIGFAFPSKRIIMNMTPANKRKEGSGYDLPVAVSLLCASEQISVADSDKTVFIGELSLDGSINLVNGVLPMVITAYQNGFTKAFVPKENANEAAVVDGMEIYPVATLKEVTDHFLGAKVIEAHTVDVNEFLRSGANTIMDFSEVKGQLFARRGLEIAAAGGHNILLIGPP